MRRRMIKTSILWALTAVWMVFIFLMSAQTGESSSALSGSLTQALVSLLTPDFHSLTVAEQTALVENWHFIIRKLGHFTEYAVLGILWFSSLCVSRVPQKLSLPIAFGVSVLYAIGDEWHQSFVGGRGPSVVDVGIDTVGILAGIAAALLAGAIIRRRRRKEKSLTLNLPCY